MVKPDVKHNYYADLDLPTNAGIDDVRKAYRKLALQFHPDRNAGKEAECVPRFQAIQAANEVLCDPTTKARYDADRRKVGLYPGTTYKANVPTPGNPYAAASAFPPPPRRTQPGQSSYQRSGADRFTNFPRAANTAPRKDPSTERTEQFRAWQSMNTGTQRPAPPPRPAASPKPPTPNASRPGMPRQDTKLPSEEQIRAGMRHGKAPTAETLNARQTAWQEYGQKGPTTRSKQQRPVPATPRRPGGFDPNAPGSDERAAPQSNHYSRRDRSDDFGYPPPPPGPPPSSGPQSPVSPNTPRPYADPLRSFRQRQDEDAPYMEGNRTSTPYAGTGGEKTQFSSEGLRRSASTRDTSKLHPESPASSTRARSTSPLGRQSQQQQKQTNTKQTRNSKPSFMPGMDSSSSSNASSDSEAQPTPRERKIAQPKPRSHRFPNHEPSPSPQPQRPPPPPAEPQSEPEQMQQRKSSTNIFSIPINHDTFSPTTSAAKSRSEENINTNFSPGGWSGKFAGSTDYFAAAETAGARRSPARRTGSRRGLYTPDSGSASASESMPPPPPPPADFTRPGNSANANAPPLPPDSTRPASLNGKFSAEEWKSTFHDASWTWPPPPSGAPMMDSAKAGLRSKTGSRKATGKLSSKSSQMSSASGVGNAGTREIPVVVDDDDDEIKSTVEVEVEPDAMDIDTPPPPTRPVADEQPAATTAAAEGARVYSIPISEWRQQQEATTRSDLPSAAKRQARNVESGLKATLDDLANVEPIAAKMDAGGSGGSGLRNLADLSSTLPFQSQASTGRFSTAKGAGEEEEGDFDLQLPALPKVPAVPMKWTKLSWHTYAQSFGEYLRCHHQFNRVVLRHFEAREKVAEGRMRDKGWVEAQGDAFGSYVRDVRVDEKVREVWVLEGERHRGAVEGFEGVRERVRRIVEGGGLVD